MIQSLGVITDIRSIPQDPSIVHFTYEHSATYLEPEKTLTLQVIWNRNTNHCLISETELDTRQSFEQLAEQNSVINLNAPLALEPVYIPKPWGQEIWYTGIEARGVCTVAGTPISWLLDLFGEQLGCHGSPLLLKILDPKPEENLGDLYFEMHEHKTEVYVVTHVNEQAWPDGAGKIRYGFNQALMSRYEDTDQFLDDYIQAVQRYQDIRNQIDGLDTPPSDAQINEEKELRQAMYDFTTLRDLRIGDVVTVQPFVPHSLQHGVRVVEFQTPHYERFILSFGQKVLTQDHWDTSEVHRAVTDPVEFDQPERLNNQETLIADFDQFDVVKITLGPGESTSIENETYRIVMGISGTATLTSESTSDQIAGEQAFYCSGSFTLSNQSMADTSVLCARQKSGQ